MKIAHSPHPRSPWVPLLLASAALVLAPTSLAALEIPPEVNQAMLAIHAREALAHVKLLAAPELAGREPGQDGFSLASRYVQGRHEAAGLAGGGESGGYSQSFRMVFSRLGAQRLDVEQIGTNSSHSRTFGVGDDFIPFRFCPAARASAPVAFAGYGIRAPEHGWDDYAGLDVRGMVVLILRHEPRERDPDSPFAGKRSTVHATFLTKVRAAQAAGAAGVLMVTDPLHHTDRRPRNSLASWPELEKERYTRDGLPVPEGRPVLEGWYDDIRIPALHVAPVVADSILAGSDRTLESLQRKLDETGTPQSFVVNGKRVTIDAAFERRSVASENILARIPGRDPALSSEVVLVGAHLDHVGRNQRGEVCPGADDNASGSAAVLEIARAFARLPQAPRRTILLVHWSGEEQGLLGSSWFVRHPLVPLDKIAGVINLDMIGRNKADEINLVGRRDAPALHEFMLAALRQVGLGIRYDAGAGAARSDNFPFLTAGVPAMSFFSGTHEDYHAPGDTADKVVPAKVEAVTRAAFLAAWMAAEEPTSRPAAAAPRSEPKDVTPPRATKGRSNPGPVRFPELPK